MASAASSASQEASSIGYDTAEDEDVNVASVIRDKPATITSDPAEMIAMHMMQFMERQVKQQQEQVSSTEMTMHRTSTPLPANSAHLVLQSEAAPLSTAVTMAMPTSQSLMSPAKEAGLTTEDYLQLIRQQMMTTPLKHGGSTSLPDEYLPLPRLLDSPVKDQYGRANKEMTHPSDDVLYARQSKDPSHTSDDVMQMINMMEEVVCEQQTPRSVSKETVSSSPDHLPTQLQSNQMLHMAAPALDSAPAQVSLSNLKDFNVKDLLSVSVLKDCIPTALLKDYVAAGLLKDHNSQPSGKDAGGGVCMPAVVAASAAPFRDCIPIASSAKVDGMVMTSAKDYCSLPGSQEQLQVVNSQSQLPAMLHPHLTMTSTHLPTSHPITASLLSVSAAHTLPHVMHLAPPRDPPGPNNMHPTAIETVKDLNQMTAVLKDYPGVGHISNIGHLAYYPVSNVQSDSRTHTPQPTDYSQSAPIHIASMMLPVALEPGQVRDHSAVSVSQDQASMAGKFPLSTTVTRLLGESSSVSQGCDSLAQDLTVAAHHPPHTSSHLAAGPHQSPAAHPMSTLPVLIAKQVEELHNAEQEVLASRASQTLLSQYVKLDGHAAVGADHVINFASHIVPTSDYAAQPHRENVVPLQHDLAATHLRRELGREQGTTTTSDYIAATVRHELNQNKDRVTSEDYLAGIRQELAREKERLSPEPGRCSTPGSLSARQSIHAGPSSVPLLEGDHIPSVVDASNCTILRYVTLGKHDLEENVVLEDWLGKFPWLVLNLSSNTFTCRMCQQARIACNFAFGVPTSALTHKDLAAHELSVQHKEAGVKLNFSLDDIDFGFEKDKDRDRPLVIDIKPSAGGVSEMDISSKVKDIVERLKSPKHPIPQEWFTKFQWLKYDAELEQFFCRVCIKQRQTNPFTAGKSIPSPKRESFAAHEDCNSHKLAVLVDLGITEEAAKAAILKEAGNSAQRNLSQELNTPSEPLATLPPVIKSAPAPKNCSIPLNSSKDSSVKAAAERFFTFCAECRGPQKRQIQVEWFIQFPWLELDINKKCFMCKFCRFYNPQGVFGTGKLIDEPRQDDLRKHGQTDAHAIAMKAYSMDPAAGNHPALHAETSGLIDVGLVMKYSNYVKQPSSKVTTPVFLEFPWLQYEDATRTYYCLLCREQREKCTISKGTVTSEQLFGHETLAHHKMALVKFEEKARQLMDFQQLQSSVLNPSASDLNMLPWRDAFWQFSNWARSMGILCDVTLNIREENDVVTSFRVHKLMLVCASEYFQMSLRDSTIDSQYTLEGMTAKGMEGILNFMYGQPVGVEPRYYLDCLQAAALLMIPQAQKYFQHLLMSFSVAKVQQSPHVEDISTYSKDVRSVTNSCNDDDGEDAAAMTDEFESASDYESTPAKVAKWTEHSDVTDSVRSLEQTKVNEQIVSTKQTVAFDQFRESDAQRFDTQRLLAVNDIDDTASVNHHSHPEQLRAVDSSPAPCVKTPGLLHHFGEAHLSSNHKSPIHVTPTSTHQKHFDMPKSFKPHQAYVQKFTEEVASSVLHRLEQKSDQPKSLGLNSDMLDELAVVKNLMSQRNDSAHSQKSLTSKKSEESVGGRANETSGLTEQLPLTGLSQKSLANGLSSPPVCFASSPSAMTPVIQSIGYSVSELIHAALGNDTKLPAGSTCRIETQRSSSVESTKSHAAVTKSKLKMESDADCENEDKKKLVIALSTSATNISTAQTSTTSAQQVPVSSSKVRSPPKASNNIVGNDLSEQPVFPIAVAAATPTTATTSIVTPPVAASAPSGLDLTPVSNIEATVTQSVGKILKPNNTRVGIKAVNNKGAKGKAKAAAAAAVAAAEARNNAKKLASRPNVRGSPRVVTDIEKLKLPGNVIRSEPAPLPTPEEQSGTTPTKTVIAQYEYAADRKRELAEYLPTCDICGKKFLRKGCIQRHKDKHHAGVKKKVSFKCDRCPKECPTRHDLKLHVRVHTGERPFKCGECNKSFTRRETLTEHEFTHKPDSEKPHQCPGCGKGFFKMHDLQRHYTGLHSGDRPFQCHQCGKAFPWARSLQDHLSAHQGSDRRRPYKCVDCDMTFVRKYDLNRHAITHTKEKPFVCEWCGHAFTQKGSMDKHKREFCRGRPGGEGRPGESKPTIGLPEGSEDMSVPIPTTNQNELDPSAALIYYSV